VIENPAGGQPAKTTCEPSEEEQCADFPVRECANWKLIAKLGNRSID